MSRFEDQREIDAFQTALLDWYQIHKRVLPWRDNPTPYRVWVSEIMLQQTRVETVIPYFERFVERYPTMEELANANDDELAKYWEGLGYYSRVRNLKKAAQIIVEKHEGIFPEDDESIAALPGIGPYTLGAIQSIAFGKKRAAIDGNVLRVFARITAHFGDISSESTKREIGDIVRRTLPDRRNSDYTQGLMEIGATVCLPNGSPKCEICPLQRFCLASANHLTDQIPSKKATKARKIEKKTVFVIITNNQFVALRKRSATGLLAGLWEFVCLDGDVDPNEWLTRYLPGAASQSKIISFPNQVHIFSHIEWHMKGYAIVIEKAFEITSMIWVDIPRLLKEFSIPTAYRPYVEWLHFQSLGGKDL
jgi:A/G-specific adenine glycosylase